MTTTFANPARNEVRVRGKKTQETAAMLKGDNQCFNVICCSASKFFGWLIDTGSHPSVVVIRFSLNT